MHWLSILGIGIAANLDNLGIGLSFGARKTIIPFRSNLLIALLSMAATCVSMYGGHFIADWFPASVANNIGGGLISLMGLLAVISTLRSASVQVSPDTPPIGGSLLSNPHQADRDGNNILSWGECWALGFALSLNCIASGIGAGAADMSIWSTTLSIGVFSLLTVGIGTKLGGSIAKTWFGRYSNALGGLLLLAIGLYEIFS